MALGAARGNIFKLVVGQGLRLSALRIAAGSIAAFILTRVMSTMLIGVKPTDPATLPGAPRELIPCRPCASSEK
jgi:predicted lysophospholipase L1 biosynthesis ABC-type transport system permease subunit